MKGFTDFVIRLQPVGREKVRVGVSSRQGEVGREREVPSTLFEPGFTASFDRALHASSPVRHVRPWIGDAEPARDLRADVEEIGRQLFNLAFFPEAMSLWERTRGEVGVRSGVRIRIQLDLHRNDTLPWASLPWELLFHEPSGGFLALDCRTPIVRYLDLPTPVPRRLEDGPWRILVLAPGPSDAEPLDRETELAELFGIWKRQGGVTPVLLEQAGASDIRQALSGSERTHAVHFLGHGTFDQATGCGGLLLEGSDGRSQKLLGSSLSKIFRGVEPPIVAVLNGCSTGRAGLIEPFAGAGTALVQAGVPSVIAMQRSIRDDAAIFFSKHFFAALQNGHPIERAVSEARVQLDIKFSESFAWAIPTLFTRLTESGSRSPDRPETHERQAQRPLVKANRTTTRAAKLYRQGAAAEGRESPEQTLLETEELNADTLDIGKVIDDDNP